MKRFTPLIALGLAAILLPGVQAQGKLGRRHAPARDAAPLTPDLAKRALLGLLLSPAAKQHAHLKGAPMEEMAKVELQKRNDGQFDWTGAFRFDPAKRTYTFLFHHGKPFPVVPPRLLIHVAVHEGSFETKDGRWVATVPKYKGTLLD